MPGARKRRELCRVRAMGRERCNREGERDSREGDGQGGRGGSGPVCRNGEGGGVHCARDGTEVQSERKGGGVVIGGQNGNKGGRQVRFGEGFKEEQCRGSVTFWYGSGSVPRTNGFGSGSTTRGRGD